MITTGSDVGSRVGLNPTRTAVLGILNRMGAILEVTESGWEAGEPVGDVRARFASLRATGGAGGGRAASDELPSSGCWGCFAEGETVVPATQEIGHKESDRVAGVADALRAPRRRGRGLRGRLRRDRQRGPRGAPSTRAGTIGWRCWARSRASHPAKPSRSRASTRPRSAIPASNGISGPWSRRSYARAMVIAIDGPAGAGKSTVARALAERLGFTLLDSGAMYRCVALVALRAGAVPEDEAVMTRIAETLDLSMAPDAIAIAGEDVSAAIRSPDISAAASRVSVHPGVRAAMVERQRALVGEGGWVAEGRDIGTVVCPEAPLKIYLTASERERAARRAGQTGEDVEAVLAAQRDRDDRDRDREHGALALAGDSVELDTTGLEIARSSSGSPRCDGARPDERGGLREAGRGYPTAARALVNSGRRARGHHASRG